MILRLIEEVIAAAIGTMAFALMFHVPRQYYFCGGIAGGAGWLVLRPFRRSLFYCVFIQNRQHCFVKKHQDNGNKEKPH